MIDRTIRVQVRLTFLLAAIVISSGCQFNPFNGGGNKSIYGSWRWVKTQGGWTGSVHTPELAGYSAKVVFQENDTALFYRNDTLLKQLAFTIFKTRTLSRRKDVFVIHWTDKDYPDSQYVLFSGNDTLHLTARQGELSHFYYVRDRY